MLASAEARCFTRAEGPSSGRTREADETTYVLADSSRPKELIFPGPRMQLQNIISVESRRYHLKDMFIVSLEYLEDGQVFAEHAKLPIHGYGENLRDALDAFCEAFDYQWQSLVEVPEETLTSGGKRRRADLMSSVKKVVEVES